MESSTEILATEKTYFHTLTQSIAEIYVRCVSGVHLRDEKEVISTQNATKDSASGSHQYRAAWPSGEDPEGLICPLAHDPEPYFTQGPCPHNDNGAGDL